MQNLIFKIIGCLIGLVILILPVSGADSTEQQVIQLPDTINMVVSSVSGAGNNSLEAASDTLMSADDAVDKTIKSIPSVELKKIFSFAKLFWAGVFFLVAYFIIRFISRSIEAWSEKNAERRIKGKAILPVVKIVSWIIVSYIVIRGIFNPPLGSLIAFGASIGVAVGFAAQDLLKNIFGGFVILIDRPFKVGDKIEVGSVYGEVLDMSLRSTRIQTADDSLVTLPNGELLNQPISNSNSGESNCQVVAEIYLPITIDTDKVRKVATEAAQTSRFIYLAKPIAVLFFNEIKHDKLCYKMRLKAYVMDIRYEFLFKSEMTEIVISDLLKAGLIDPEISI
ncbi:mechanosensitive ion channel family protein [Mangrovibacterium lignilyticum]|uniref:mechanosensitive ion channel family protein n=1 Tax=Mangrovibacterium lignilyticum TaxID=2668052 RepID=UPI0019682B5C|nr:mechanosensitive ion channel domain-containing protein [Mangrovibacterium lignilyticum]